MDPADARLFEETVEKLARLAVVMKIQPADLDTLVYDCATDRACRFMNQTIDEAEQEEILVDFEERASDINNGGLFAQIDFLIRYGEVEELIEDFVTILQARLIDHGANGHHASRPR